MLELGLRLHGLQHVHVHHAAVVGHDGAAPEAMTELITAVPSSSVTVMKSGPNSSLVLGTIPSFSSSLIVACCAQKCKSGICQIFDEAYIHPLLERIRVDKLEEYAIISAIAACDEAILQAYVFHRKTEVSFCVNIQSGPQSEPGPEAEAAVHGCGGCGHGREGAGHLPPDLRDHGAILLCFAAVYIKTVIIPQAHLEANFVMNQTSTIYYKDSTTGEYVEHLSLHGTENRQLVDLRRSQII